MTDRLFSVKLAWSKTKGFHITVFTKLRAHTVLVMIVASDDCFCGAVRGFGSLLRSAVRGIWWLLRSAAGGILLAASVGS